MMTTFLVLSVATSVLVILRHRTQQSVSRSVAYAAMSGNFLWSGHRRVLGCLPPMLWVIVGIAFCVFVGLMLRGDVRMVDAMFLAVSVSTSTGLSTTEYTQWSSFHHAMLFVGMVLGSNILLAAVPALWRHRELQARKARSTSREEVSMVMRESTAALLVAVVSAAIWVMLVATTCILLVPKFSWSWSMFLSVSLVSNIGLSPSRTDFMEYRNDSYILFVCSIVMPLGNALFPVVLRSSIALMSEVCAACCGWKFLNRSLSQWRDAADLLLGERPPAWCCFVFSRIGTLQLTMFWVALTVVEMLMFVPEFNTAMFPTNADVSDQILLSWFQTLSVRTTGLMVFDITRFRVGHLSFWMLAMYVSAYPLALVSFRSQRAGGGAALAGRDLTWIYVSVIVLLFVEDQRIPTDAKGSDSSVFLRSCFEAVSAFGNVGLSLSRSPGVVSYSGELNDFSKVVVMTLMICGKLRCLPWSLVVDESESRSATVEVALDVVDDVNETEEMMELT